MTHNLKTAAMGVKSETTSKGSHLNTCSFDGAAVQGGGGSFKTPALDTISGSLRPWRWYLAWVLGGVYPLPFSFSLSASWSVKTQPAPTSINIMSFLLWWTLLLTRSYASVENFVSDGKSNITTPGRTSSEVFMHWTNPVTKLCVKWESPTRKA